MHSVAHFLFPDQPAMESSAPATGRAWEQYLQEVQRNLPLRVYAAAVISLHEMGVQLVAMQSPWLAQLRGPMPES